MNFDVSQFQTGSLTEADVDVLVVSMYTTLDANEAITGLLKSSSSNAVEQRLRWLATNSDPEIRCNAAEMLIRLSSPHAIEAINTLLGSRDKDVKCAGCRLLPSADSHYAKNILLELLKDDDDDVRYLAVDGLGEIGDTTAIPVLLEVGEKDVGFDYEGRPIREKAHKSVKAIRERFRAM